jgi:F-type H+-transporting ATPase subunit epsilon
MNSKLTLIVVSQEKELLTTTVDSVTAQTTEGEITVLPQHLPVFTQLQTGVLTYRNEKDEQQLVVSKGFLDVGPDNQITVMVDTATHARDISLEKAEKAITAAHETMKLSSDRQELLLAEASLKQALLEVKVARSSKRSQI